MHAPDRREFLQSSTLAAAAAIAPWVFNSVSAQDSAMRDLNVGVIGAGRGMEHANMLLESKGISLNYMCDVDRRRLDSR